MAADSGLVLERTGRTRRARVGPPVCLECARRTRATCALVRARATTCPVLARAAARHLVAHPANLAPVSPARHQEFALRTSVCQHGRGIALHSATVPPGIPSTSCTPSCRTYTRQASPRRSPRAANTRTRRTARCTACSRALAARGTGRCRLGSPRRTPRSDSAPPHRTQPEPSLGRSPPHRARSAPASAPHTPRGTRVPGRPRLPSCKRHTSLRLCLHQQR